METRQSTYWDLKDVGDTTRVHFIDKQEFNYSQHKFDGWSLLDEHSLLIDYKQEWRSKYIRGDIEDAEPVWIELSRAVAEHSPRSPETYFNPVGAVEILDSGDGQLFDGPELISRSVLDVLHRHNVRTRVFNSRKPLGSMKLLLAGRNFVVARDFRLEQLDTGE